MHVRASTVNKIQIPQFKSRRKLPRRRNVRAIPIPRPEIACKPSVVGWSYVAGSKLSQSPELAANPLVVSSRRERSRPKIDIVVGQLPGVWTRRVLVQR